MKIPVKMVELVWMESTHTAVSVLLDTLDSIVKQVDCIKQIIRQLSNFQRYQ